MKPADHARALGVLRQARWLQGYAPALAEALLAEGRLVRRAAGEWAQAEGDDRGGLFVVIAGVLHSYCAAPGDREVMIGLAEAGAVLGHATRFSGGPRLVTAVCVEPCILLELSEAALDRVAQRQAEIWRAIADFTYANMRSVLRMAAEVISLPPRQRIAARLLAAAQGRPPAATGHGPITLRLSQELLGEMTGLSRKTVNLHLAALEMQGMIVVRYGAIGILRPDALAELADHRTPSA